LRLANVTKHQAEYIYFHHVLEQFNAISPKLTFTLEEEHGKQLNYMDITITRNEKQFTFDIYRKPTTTDHIIPKDSCHPHEHKTSAIRYLVNRMETYPIGQKNKIQESQTIQHVLQTNKYNPNIPLIKKQHQAPKSTGQVTTKKTSDFHLPGKGNKNNNQDLP
jgi:hypothetical protein